MPRAKRRSSAKSRRINRPCTYELGYVRQDLYACTLCTENAYGEVSAFCRGCRDACHADHLDATFELYTKRAFRCDCGNGRARNTCCLQPDKDDCNEANKYSHNFAGRYCRCDRRYDPQLAMAQCAMCEDWFHESCYTTDAAARGRVTDPSALSGYELTCRDCVRALPALADYYEQLSAWTSARPRPRPPTRDVCARPRPAAAPHRPGTLDLLWTPGFRVALCRCRNCLAMYAAAGAAYIVDRADFVGAPEPEDADLLKPTNDEDIVSDVLDDSARADPKPTPRKAVAAVRDGEQAPAAILTSDEILTIQKRIRSFIQHSIATNGGNLNKDSLRGYLSDLKAEMLATDRKERGL